jgi:predicted nucleic acid-binding protein
MAKGGEFLFDTGALIDIYRGRTTVRPRFQTVVDGKLSGYVSVITEAELWRGVKPMELDRHEAILSFFQSLTLDSRAARLAGEWMQKYEPHGLGWMDALIVATARHAGLAVLTRDARLAQVLAGEAQFEVYPAA